MADYDRRPRGRGGYSNNNNKRRYRGELQIASIYD